MPKFKTKTKSKTQKLPKNNTVEASIHHPVRWVVIAVLILVVGIVLLNIMGRLFIREVVQEVKISEEKEITDIQVGTKAPFWELSDIAGNNFAVSDFLDAPLVLTFWTTWNLASADQIKIFDEYLAQNDETLFKIVAINNQEDQSVVFNFVRRGGYKMRILLDESGEIGEKYQARTLPVTYFIDKNGVIQDVFVGVLSEEMLVEKAEAIIR